MKACDLHTHSIYSDGTYTPGQIIDEAEALGLSAVALCDHNTVDGLPDFLRQAEGRNIEAVPGVEFSVDHEGTEVHLLALYIPERAFGALSAITDEMSRRKAESNVALVHALNEAGYALDIEAIRRTTPNGKFNRVHVGAELTRLGYTNSVDHAFDTLLARGLGFYQTPERMPFFEVLAHIRSIGAVPVLAHPFLNLGHAQLEAFLPKAKACGLVGMECYYSTYDDATTACALDMACRFGLKPSGGSDFHGANKPDIALGSGRGGLAVPYEWAEALKNRTL